MVIKEKKKTNKQKGGVNNNNNNEFSRAFRNKSKSNSNNSHSPLSTIFNFRPKQNFKSFIAEKTNRILWSQHRKNFIQEIKNFLISKIYQQNIPVFYGNMSSNYSIGYNEYICKIVGVFSSRKRIFIINPFAELVYRFYILCINEKYRTDELHNLLKKLLKLDKFKGFPEILYLPHHGIRFCIVKDSNGIEKVITSQESNISRCSITHGCSLMMSAEIREENLPSDQDLVEFYNILGNDVKLWDLLLSIQKEKYKKIRK